MQEGAAKFADGLVDMDKGTGFEKREFIIDGNNFHDIESFYVEMEKLFSADSSFSAGHNLEAFNDLLRGGFGVHKYGEPITIRWIHFSKSRKDLGQAFISKIMEIIENKDDSGHDCLLNTKD